MADKRIDAIQDDIKLLKGEIKQSLSSVRDYLLNMELPSSEIANILAALSTEGEKITMKGSLESPPERQPAPAQELQNPPSSDMANHEEMLEMDDAMGDSSLSQASAMDGQVGDDSFGSGSFPDESNGFGNPMSSESLPEERESSANRRPQDNSGAADFHQDDDVSPKDRQPSFDYPDFDEETRDPYSQYDEPADMGPYDSRLAPEDSIPRVNMLANLINWVSRAKQEIGAEQLSVFLEVYGISGHLSPELKDIILHLAEITGDKSPVNSSAGVWSESMLSLHGILTGGEAPLHPVLPSWCAGPDTFNQMEEEDIDEPEEEEEVQEMPVKLKLVFPSSKGKDREYCIDLSPEMEEEADDPVRRPKRNGR